MSTPSCEKNVNVINNAKIKGLLRELGYTYRSIEAVSTILTKNKLTKKLNGKCPWFIEEALELGRILNMSREQFIEIFMPLFLDLTSQKCDNKIEE